MTVLPWLLVFAVLLAGLLSLALAMPRHGEQVLGRPLRGRVVWRIGGWSALVLALWSSVQVWGWSVGPVYWLGGVTLAALLLVGGLAYRPRWLVAGVGGMVAVVVFWAFSSALI